LGHQHLSCNYYRPKFFEKAVKVQGFLIVSLRLCLEVRGKGGGGIFGEKKDEREVERMIPFRLLF
jgi:hypothetical protein